jgi:hypothetical protein
MTSFDIIPETSSPCEVELLSPAIVQIAAVWPGLLPHIREAILTLVDGGRARGEETTLQATSCLESVAVQPSQGLLDVCEIAWPIAQQCRSIVQACLREEEWQDGDTEFCDVIGREIAAWCK